MFRKNIDKYPIFVECQKCQKCSFFLILFDNNYLAQDSNIKKALKLSTNLFLGVTCEIHIYFSTLLSSFSYLTNAKNCNIKHLFFSQQICTSFTRENILEHVEN